MRFWNQQAVTWKYGPVIEKGERDLVLEDQARGHLAASDLTKETRLMFQIFTGIKRFRSFLRDSLIAKTIRFVIVNQADCLHERVADRRAHELEPAPQEISTQRVRIRGVRPQRGAALSSKRVPVDESPDIIIKTSEFFLDRQKSPGVLNRSRDLQTVANNAFVLKQPGNFPLVVFRDSCRIEFIKSAAVVFTLSQDRLPTQSRLRAFQNQEFKQRPIVVDRDAPLTIVVGNGQIRFRPVTATNFLHLGFILYLHLEMPRRRQGYNRWGP